MRPPHGTGWLCFSEKKALTSEWHSGTFLWATLSGVCRRRILRQAQLRNEQRTWNISGPTL